MSKQEQELEIAPDPVDDGIAPIPESAPLPPTPAVEEPPAEQREPLRMSPGDAKRAEFAARFAQERADAEQDTMTPFDGDWTNQENMYGVHGRQPQQQPVPGAAEPGVPAHALEAPADDGGQGQEPVQRRLIPLKVHGQTYFVTEDQLIAEAQKSIAAGNLLEGAKDIHRNARQHANRPRNDLQSDQAREDAQHQGDPLRPLVEEFQYGDPDRAAIGLRNTIADQSSRMVKEEMLKERMRDHLARSQHALNEVIAENTDLKDDPDVEAAVTWRMQRYYREDLAALGLDPATMPQDPVALAD